MPRPSGILLASLGGAAVLYALTRTDRGQAVATDVLGEVVVTAKKAAAALLPRGLRNNNPGNIEWIADPARRWRGMVGQDGRYGVFDTAANGVRAIGGELRASVKRGQTLAQAIHEWAPASENDTDSYLSHVSRLTGLQPNAKLAASHIPAVAEAIILHENGINPYNAADIAAWVNA